MLSKKDLVLNKDYDVRSFLYRNKIMVYIT